ncbi:MAG: DNA-3-methyladenine glycosylase 2 family protein [Ignavibacteria bacterium]|jgi:DNA-3-methyladenine glycosylase II|nr:DNA-3-methyladenine glycosylase 2 family protein [Ignavibacteria bacterium]HEX2962961.1 DNA-3-methyladenine glycosylase [Ignavibacteriales bacterium]MCU7498472.1 DNA-3-methyladenine glycosylase 2 family protein [Ignavibacteria bacterium]MCU7512630.1 DNA-3-methyladenine glycosylase 2 family protein [Ignavibacteria bacterium]MCU7521238.1 DNA-3-methyladenine glycosylase 2 family protein [Ignavibacteria bacterium]
MENDEIISGIRYLSRKDKCLAGIIKKAGPCTLKAHRNYYYSLLESIIGQQLSMKVAQVIIGRFMDYYKDTPRPELILETDDQVLRSLGLSNAKVKYVKDLSEKLLSGEVSLKNINKKSDEEIIEELTKVKGIGIWTAHMFLIFTLCRMNVLPTGDLGIKRAIMLNYNLGTMPDEEMIRQIAQENKWHPYSTLASWYLWKSLEF